MEGNELILDDLPVAVAPGERKKTPVFIKVLCILTFVGSAFHIMRALWGIVTVSAMNKMFNVMNIDNLNRYTDPIFSFNTRDYQNYFNWLLYSYYTSLAGCAFAIIGAVMMLYRKKAGFFIYLVGEVIPVVLSVMVIIAAQKVSFLGIWGSIGSGATIAVSIAFILMYSVNYRHFT